MSDPAAKNRKNNLREAENEERKQLVKHTPDATQAQAQAQAMSKLSPSLKALINAPFARPGQAPAPRNIRDVYTRIANEAREHKYGDRPWVTLSAAATFTLNSPASLLALHDLTPTLSPSLTPLTTAELIREIGLKCISFNGIPRTINNLATFRAGLSHHPWSGSLRTTPSRTITSANLPATAARGDALWQSVYTPFDEKLVQRLAESHPDLPVHILGSHYGPLLSDPESADNNNNNSLVGRCLTSVLAVACLRAQTGVGPQVLSHVFGLRKGVEQGAHRGEFAGLEEGRVGEAEAEAVERLAGDEGCEWLLRSVDAITEAVGSSYARWDGEGEGGKAKL
ncbi:uncharacterized protein B0H64DRAFT_56249 [Chaetomium fimeti]|uniref:Dol-P-Man:Man(5)GlcNAc(2)-PP-Dol alpha-1,3-mannosyltransferase n=1 Tax=Chaetomium fimeti TaxID=1854472 RepID=A0AAE0LN52_9PEZI|nr:hypothetical protein B0H64DRAFT_56249 [Chaetomium fimeti]